jgi:hypothetical protein
MIGLLAVVGAAYELYRKQDLEPLELSEAVGIVLDGGLLLFLGVAGCGLLWLWGEQGNPEHVVFGGYTGLLNTLMIEKGAWADYNPSVKLLYPYLTALSAMGGDLSLGAQALSLVVTGLVPAGSYLLARLHSNRIVALAAGLLILQHPLLYHYALYSTSAALFCLLLTVSLAAVGLALLWPRAWSWGLVGVLGALCFSTSDQALEFLGPALVGGMLLWVPGAWMRREVLGRRLLELFGGVAIGIGASVLLLPSGVAARIPELFHVEQQVSGLIEAIQGDFWGDNLLWLGGVSLLGLLIPATGEGIRGGRLAMLGLMGAFVSPLLAGFDTERVFFLLPLLLVGAVVGLSRLCGLLTRGPFKLVAELGLGGLWVLVGRGWWVGNTEVELSLEFPPALVEVPKDAEGNGLASRKLAGWLEAQREEIRIEDCAPVPISIFLPHDMRIRTSKGNSRCPEVLAEETVTSVWLLASNQTRYRNANHPDPRALVMTGSWRVKWGWDPKRGELKEGTAEWGESAVVVLERTAKKAEGAENAEGVEQAGGSGEGSGVGEGNGSGFKH